jgi:hypothetical protein
MQRSVRCVSAIVTLACAANLAHGCTLQSQGELDYTAASAGSGAKDASIGGAAGSSTGGVGGNAGQGGLAAGAAGDAGSGAVGGDAGLAGQGGEAGIGGAAGAAGAAGEGGAAGTGGTGGAAGDGGSAGSAGDAGEDASDGAAGTAGDGGDAGPDAADGAEGSAGAGGDANADAPDGPVDGPSESGEASVDAADGAAGSAGDAGDGGDAADAGQCPCSLWPTSSVPSTEAYPDNAAVELGVKFQTSMAGHITAIRFYKGAGNGGTHVGSLWLSNGTKLGSVPFTAETATGWQTATFATPIAVSTGQTYIASYFAPLGHYPANPHYFSAAHTNGPLTAPSSASSNGNGVYRYGAQSGFPTQTYSENNYWVDVVLTTP